MISRTHFHLLFLNSNFNIFMREEKKTLSSWKCFSNQMKIICIGQRKADAHLCAAVLGKEKLMPICVLLEMWKVSGDLTTAPPLQIFIGGIRVCFSWFYSKGTTISSNVMILYCYDRYYMASTLLTSLLARFKHTSTSFPHLDDAIFPPFV